METNNQDTCNRAAIDWRANANQAGVGNYLGLEWIETAGRSPVDPYLRIEIDC